MEISGAAQTIAPFAAVSLAAAGTVYWFLFQSARKEATAAKNAVAHIKESCKADTAALREEFAAYKLHVSERYVTQNALTTAVASLERAIEQLLTTIKETAKEQREAIEGIHRRIDQKADK